MKNATIAVLLTLAACDYDPPGRCASSSECLEGQVCASGVCAAGIAAPNEAPAAAAGAGIAQADEELVSH